MGMKDDIQKVLITEEEIQAKVKELGGLLTKEYEGRFPLAVGVLKGAMPFMADLLKHIDTYLEMEFYGRIKLWQCDRFIRRSENRQRLEHLRRRTGYFDH